VLQIGDDRCSYLRSTQGRSAFIAFLFHFLFLLCELPLLRLERLEFFHQCRPAGLHCFEVCFRCLLNVKISVSVLPDTSDFGGRNNVPRELRQYFRSSRFLNPLEMYEVGNISPRRLLTNSSRVLSCASAATAFACSFLTYFAPLISFLLSSFSKYLFRE
jgi:hypothetical protein